MAGKVTSPADHLRQTGRGEGVVHWCLGQQRSGVQVNWISLSVYQLVALTLSSHLIQCMAGC